MTLYESFMVPCNLMERQRVADGEGGWSTQWVEGDAFDAAIVLDSNALALIAEAKGVESTFTVTVGRDVQLAFHDAFKRSSDGRTFRIVETKDPTPDAATFQFNQYRAEAWELA